ncbi:hypothetical protein ABK040_005213 [Willaertia magna]
MSTEISWKIFHNSRNNSNNKSLKFIVISDTHNKHDYLNIPDGDILICCGDISCSENDGSSLQDLKNFNNYLSQITQVKHKIVIAGNHDKSLTKFTKEQIQTEIFTNATYLQDSFVIIDGIKIYGTPFVPATSALQASLNPFYKSEQTLMASVFSKIESDTNILVTHCPPYGILDKNNNGTVMHYGSKSLVERIKELKDLKVNVFGHVHGGYGYVEENNVTFVNAACDGCKQPIVFDFIL